MISLVTTIGNVAAAEEAAAVTNTGHVCVKAQARVHFPLMSGSPMFEVHIGPVASLRESIYRLLPQTTTENISKNFELYAIDPATRYPNLNSTCVRPHQVSPTL